METLIPSDFRKVLLQWKIASGAQSNLLIHLILQLFEITLCPQDHNTVITFSTVYLIIYGAFLYISSVILSLSLPPALFVTLHSSLSPSLRDFDASLYLCEEAFGLLPLDTFERLAGTLLVYPYLCTLSVLLVVLALAALTNLRYSNKQTRGKKQTVS